MHLWVLDLSQGQSQPMSDLPLLQGAFTWVTWAATEEEKHPWVWVCLLGFWGWVVVGVVFDLFLLIMARMEERHCVQGIHTLFRW